VIEFKDKEFEAAFNLGIEKHPCFSRDRNIPSNERRCTRKLWSGCLLCVKDAEYNFQRNEWTPPRLNEMVKDNP